MENGRGLRRGDSHRTWRAAAVAAALAAGSVLGGPTAAVSAADPITTATPMLVPVVVVLDQSTATAPNGLHRVDPEAIVSIKVSVTPATDLSTGTLVETIPDGWMVETAAGATWDSYLRTLSWEMVDLSAGATTERSFTVTAPPLPTAGASHTLTGTFSLRLAQPFGNSIGPDLAILVAPRIVPGAVRVGWILEPGAEPAWRAPGESIGNVPRYRPFRLRFELANPDDLPTGLTPALELLAADETTWTTVPAGTPAAGAPFHATREWTKVAGGTALGPTWGRSEPLPDEPDRTMGWRASGQNPGDPVQLRGREATFVEFSVAATVDAVYGASYTFRLTDGGAPLPFAPVATVTTEAPHANTAGTDWQAGVDVDGAGRTTIRYPLPLAGAAGIRPTGGLAYPIRMSSGLTFASLDPSTNVHDGLALLRGDCAVCHESHASVGRNLNIAATQYESCTLCHNGTATGTTANIVDDYTTGSGAAPSNDPSTGSWYAHDLAAPGHNLDGSEDELAGALNRHAQCADCHTPHRTSSADGIVGTDRMGRTTWLASGRLAGAYGVAVANGAAGTAPTYTLERTTSATPEYQVCLKCHSGFTNQLAADPSHPSWDHLDKGIELNPANNSTHPIEAPGKNATDAMIASLAGPSSYKLWNFTPGSVIRCSNCHGDSRLEVTAMTSSPPAVSASSPLHASGVRGILLANYRDRILSTSAAPYAAADFALCYLCHAEAPFTNTTGDVVPESNFQFHGFHVSALAGMGAGGTEIDTAGAGEGNAICAECHYRIHGTALAYDAADRTNYRLVNFAPNVVAEATSGTRGWIQLDASSGTCTLTCHGAPHVVAGYGSAVGGGAPVGAGAASSGPHGASSAGARSTVGIVGSSTPSPSPTPTPTPAATPSVAASGAPKDLWEFFTWLMRN